MPTPADIALADDIVDTLNTRWTGRLLASRDWIPDLKAKNGIDTLRVSVVPGIDPSGDPVERGSTFERWPIDIGFAQRLQLKTREEIDGLVELVDEVRALLQFATFTLGDGRHFDPEGRFEFLARFDPALLNREERGEGADLEVIYTGAFLSVIRFEYLLMI